LCAKQIDKSLNLLLLKKILSVNTACPINSINVIPYNNTGIGVGSYTPAGKMDG